MTDLLDRAITESLAEMVAAAPTAGPMPTERTLKDGADRRRPLWLIAAAAAVVLVGVAGIVAVTTRPNTSSTPAASSTPVAPVGSAPHGVFPYGGMAGAISAGYRTPVDAVNAYLAAITDPASLPAGYSVSAHVAGSEAVTTVDADHAVVRISLQTPDDTGDGAVAVQRVRADPDAWQVATAQVVGDELHDVGLVDGTLTGTVATASGGSTTLYAYDLSSGAVLDSTTVATPAAAQPGTNPAAAPFTLQVGTASQVGLRYWNTVAPAGAFQFANFADRVVSSDPQAGHVDRTSVTPPTLTAPPSIVPSATSAPQADTGPAGALVLPASSGMTVDGVEQGALGGGEHIRWYATTQTTPEDGPYLQLTSATQAVPAGQRLGCVIDDPTTPGATRNDVLADGTPVCLTVRGPTEPYGRIAIDRSPISVVIDGNATDDQLVAAATNIAASPSGGFEIAPAGLPAGVTEIGAGVGVSDFATASSAAAERPMIQAGWSDGANRLLFYLATNEDPSFVPTMRLDFDTVTDKSIRGEPGFLRTRRDQPGYLGAVWSHGGTTYQVGSQGLTEVEFRQLLDELQVPTANEWNDLVASLPATPAFTARTTLSS